MVKISQPVSAAWVAAAERAYANRKAGRVVTMVKPGTYTAPSSKGDGTTYTVTVSNLGRLEGTCTCPHGQAAGSGHCWHLAMSICQEVRRVSRPAPAPAQSVDSATAERRDRFSKAFGATWN